MESTQPQATESPLRRLVESSVMIALATAFVVVSIIRQQEGLSGSKGVDGRIDAVGIIIAAALTLIMYSFLYRDNPLFKIAESTYIGAVLGWNAISTWRQALRTEIFNPLVMAPSHQALIDALWFRCVPILLGVMLLTRLSRKHGWLSRYAYAMIVGWGAGLSIVVMTDTNILEQLQAAAMPLQAGVGPGAGWWGNVGALVGALTVLIGTVCVLFYFFFSVPHGKIGQKVSKTGIWFLMLSFGASFGYTVMARISLVIGRMQFLLFDWLKIPQ
ncbi:MAG: hypothetical protein NT031_06005 [Planctomycetota bacterium]|nr:hypothetical protein [Planctomycetota bacterium]